MARNASKGRILVWDGFTVHATRISKAREVHGRPWLQRHNPRMSLQNATQHVYRREISADQRTSLSVLAGLIEPASLVLDLGCGSGALGAYLSQQNRCRLDGLTFNETEADLARPHYRRVEVADLETADLSTLFKGQRYDSIVCADVLEHLRQPDRILDQCRALLAPQGRLLISIPNAGYAGLVAELMQGEFRYRDEGLLDRTHLRFFTRQSLLRFLAEKAWGVEALDTIERELPDSEFATWFDALPPALAQSLLAMPDALSYQFIATARPGTSHADHLKPKAINAQALFTAQVYLGTTDGYDERHKVQATGVIGSMRQTLQFKLESDLDWRRLRLDPADRPGFLHLYRMALKNGQGHTLWFWDASSDGLAPLEAQAHHDILLQAPGLASQGAALTLLYGADPWIELPLPAQLVHGPGCSLEVELGWPMSADFLALSRSVRQIEHRRQAELEQAQLATQRVQEELETQQLRLRQQSSLQAAERQALQTQLTALQRQHHTLQTQQEALLRQKQEVQGQNLRLHARAKRLQGERDSLHQHLLWIEQSNLFRLTRPLIRLKLWAQRPRLPHETTATDTMPLASPQALPVPTLSHPVDVIVPVYKGLGDTRRCILSALAQTQQTPWQLIVINDCSPEPEVTDWLRETAAHEPRMQLLENAENLGFVATVNRGMSLNPGHDVVLLNSDTEVANDWLDRLVRAAHANGRVGTVTPFSNNATICSYPRFCEPNPLPTGFDTARLDALFASTNPGQVVDVPTGIGFCMYIRRDCLDEVGLFDVANFGKGYGEENDFCCRAEAAGWRNLHALDTFVLHAGGVSFGASKSARELAAMETLRRLHPQYERAVHEFIGRDPAQLARLAADLARLKSPGRPVILLVAHNREGGTLRHVHELAEHLGEAAHFLLLRPASGERVQLELLGASEALALSFHIPQEWHELIQTLRGLGVVHLHYQHILGHHPSILELPEALEVGYDFTAHDYYSFCPQISLTDQSQGYCGEKGVEQCRQCLSRSPAPGGVDIDTWRAQNLRLLDRARYILAPSRDAARRMARFVNTGDIRLAPHTDLPAWHTEPRPRPLAAEARLKVVVLGALSTIKGADLLESVALEAARLQAPIEFHLLGYAYRSLRTLPKAQLTVHGAYQEAELPGLLDWLQPDLVWFPAQWPETYSYTLSASLGAGLPIVAPLLGAFPERLQHRAWTWLQAWDSTPAEWLALFQTLRSQHFVPGLPPVPAPASPAEAIDVRIGDWSYHGRYLEGLPQVDQSVAVHITPEFLQALRSDRPPTDGLAAVSHGLRQRTLHALLRLRSAPGLRGLAQRISPGWQRRVKSWLVR